MTTVRDPRSVPEDDPPPPLAGWLLDRLAEDERLARAAIDEVGAHRAGEAYWDGSGPAGYDSFPSYPWGSGDAELSYMAGPGQPSRVLAEVAAKRRIIAEHAEYETSDRFDGPLVPRGQCRTCAWWEECDYDGPPHVEYPCLTLRLLALPYADHPDYREEWKP